MPATTGYPACEPAAEGKQCRDFQTHERAELAMSIDPAAPDTVMRVSAKSS